MSSPRERRFVNARSILLFEASTTPSIRRAYDSVFRYAKGARWNVRTIEYDLAAQKRRHSRSNTVCDVRGILDLWQPDGVIVECGGRTPVFRLGDFGRTPFVLLYCDPQLVGGRAACIHTDPDAVVRVAARELLSLGFDDYAFVPYPENVIWNSQRRDAFARMVKLGRKRFHLVAVAREERETDSIKALAKHLAALPKPCGILAVNDDVGRDVIAACEVARIPVPDDVAVVGIDNDEPICENAATTLTSIDVDWESGGRLAAELLGMMMDGRTVEESNTSRNKVKGIVRRASTRRYADAKVAAAVEYIRCHACEGVSRERIAAQMGCGTRSADMRFVAMTGHSVFEEIRSARIEKVKALLGEAKHQFSAIADICGYPTLAELCRDFRRTTGMSMSEWRNS